MKNSKIDKVKNICLSLILPILLVAFKPLNLDLKQSIVLASLLLTIIWWTTEVINKDIASLFLIISFIIFGSTSIDKVLYFPLSSNMVLVVTSYLLSQGIINTKIADTFSKFLLDKYCYTSVRLVLMSFVLGILFIIIIPQPFPRMIILASIYLNFLKNKEVDEESKSIIIFSIFVAATVTSLSLLNGDVIINYSAMKFGNIDLNYLEWAKYMFIPTIITTILVAISFIILFKKYLKHKFINQKTEEFVIEKNGKITLGIMALVIILWMTESFHGISAANVALIGTLIMFCFKILNLKSFKAVNLSLLLFLTAEFSIGKVLVGSGVADKLNEFLISFFPYANSWFYIPFIVILIMVMHMVMGSLITAISIMIPTLIALTGSHLSNETIVLLTTTSVCFHYIFPFHHVGIMIGYGNGYYKNRHTIKMGIILTIITLFAVLFIYVSWWKMFGLL